MTVVTTGSPGEDYQIGLPARWDGRDWFGTGEVADWMGLTKQTLLNRLLTGELKAMRTGPRGHWRIHRDDLLAWVNAR